MRNTKQDRWTCQFCKARDCRFTTTGNGRARNVRPCTSAHDDRDACEREARMTAEIGGVDND